MSMFLTTGEGTGRPARKVKRKYYDYREDVISSIVGMNVKRDYAELSAVDFQNIVVAGWSDKRSPDATAHDLYGSICQYYQNWAVV